MMATIKWYGLFLFCFLTACTSIQTQTYNPVVGFAGVYKGEVVSGGQLIPVITTFIGDKNGLKSGSYVMTEKDGKQVQGTLDDFKREGTYTYFVSWHDQYGDGKLRVLFSDFGYVFKGFWGSTSKDAEIAKKYPTQVMSSWNGHKE